MKEPISMRIVEKALELPGFDSRTAQTRMAPMPRLATRPAGRPGQARLGGVLLLLYVRQQKLHVLLTRRRDDLQSHAGQISFPGGRNEPGESLLRTALRETHEEVGVSPERLSVLGELSPLYIFPSDYEVHPFVAWYSNGDQPVFAPSETEVAEIVETPVENLLDPGIRREELWTIRGFELQVPFFEIQSHKVWGATAMMLSEFVERIRLAAQD